MRLFGFQITAHRLPPVSTPPADGQAAYLDATILLVRAYAGRAWSRRTSPMSARRWNAAYALLVDAEIVTGPGPIAHDYTTCLFLLWQAHARQVQLQAQRNYVPAEERKPR